MTALATSTTTLTAPEQQRLSDNEAVIERGLKTFYEVGSALLDIRDARLYRAQYRTFEAYCQERWGWARNYANKIIASAEVINNLGTIVPILPANESQARPLAQLPAEQQPEAWRVAVDTAPNGKPTAAHVASVVEMFRAPATDDSLPFVPTAADYADPYGDEDLPPPAPTRAIVHEAAASVEWYTPIRYIDAARRTLGRIDLDPASCQYAQARIGAAAWCGLDHPDADRRDGLDAPWYGRVWLNPPYGAVGGRAVAAEWAERLIAAFDASHVTAAILLVNAVIDSKWFDQLWRFPICLTNHRIKFDLPPDAPPETNASPIIGSAFVYIGPHLGQFVRHFSPFGSVVKRLEGDR